VQTFLAIGAPVPELTGRVLPGTPDSGGECDETAVTEAGVEGHGAAGDSGGKDRIGEVGARIHGLRQRS
jgi:hypothetical protein